jgi:hypothetical protein
VLADQGLQLIAAQTASDSVYRALAQAGVANPRVTLSHFLQHVAAPSTLTTRMQTLVRDNADLRTELDRDTLRVFALGLNRKIRILQPNGKMTVGGRDTDPLLTLVWVREPAPHYRAAQPIPQVQPQQAPPQQAPPVLNLPVLAPPQAVVAPRPRTRSLSGQDAPKLGNRPRTSSL